MFLLCISVWLRRSVLLAGSYVLLGAKLRDLAYRGPAPPAYCELDAYRLSSYA